LCFRWELVSVVVLLCQGLIFENDEQIQESAILGFGITAAIILIGALAMSAFNTIRRVLRRDTRELLLSNFTLSALQGPDKLEILQLFSQLQTEESGNILIRRESLARLAPGQRIEILGIVEKQFDLGDAEFENHVSQIRIKSAELDEIRTSSVSVLNSPSAINRGSMDFLGSHHETRPQSGTITMGVSVKRHSVDQHFRSAE
jgi:hypothetical protein